MCRRLDVLETNLYLIWEVKTDLHTTPTPHLLNKSPRTTGADPASSQTRCLAHKS